MAGTSRHILRESFEMRKKRGNLSGGGIVFLFAGLLLYAALGTREAHAYFDPGSGGVIISVVATILTACLVAVKVFWFRLKAIFGFLMFWKRPTSGEQS